MDLIPIGEAAARLGMSSVRPALLRRTRAGSARRNGAPAGGCTGSDDLRRLAFIKIFHQLGVSLDTAAAVLDAPAPQWREIVREQISQLDEVISAGTGRAAVPHARTALSDRSSGARMPHDDGGAGPARRRYDSSLSWPTSMPPMPARRRRADLGAAVPTAMSSPPTRPPPARPHQHVPRPRAHHVQQRRGRRAFG